MPSKKWWGGGCGSVVKQLSGMCKALGLIHRATKAKKNRVTQNSTFWTSHISNDSNRVPFMLSNVFFHTFAWNIWKRVIFGERSVWLLLAQSELFPAILKGEKYAIYVHWTRPDFMALGSCNLPNKPETPQLLLFLSRPTWIQKSC